MTLTEIQIACAECAGYRIAALNEEGTQGTVLWATIKGDKYVSKWEWDTRLAKCEPTLKTVLAELPNYPESRDAIVPLIKDLPEDKHKEFLMRLRVIVGDEKKEKHSDFWVVCATPLQLCIAYLKTKGLYHE